MNANTMNANLPTLPDELLQALRRLKLVSDELINAEPLLGGVSSDIWKVTRAGGPIVVKRALTKLRVADDWLAPVERSGHEAAWLRMAHDLMPQAAPALLGFDEESGVLAMAYLHPQQFPSWKQQLFQGTIDPAIAAEVGRRIGVLHSLTAADHRWRPKFDDPKMFESIRIDPYFLAVARRHPDRAAQIIDTVGAMEEHASAVIHGDFSPKNIHIGADGPVILDAECATWGDPAFDLAFCLTHLLLKALAMPARSARFREASEALTSAYLAEVDWEPAVELDRRAARILTVLLLARVDGKSPVDYLNVDAQSSVRCHARESLLGSYESLCAFAATWIGFA
jgi:tRNA A-37 threonylcarbamoyl transferase component Bud32